MTHINFGHLDRQDRYTKIISILNESNPSKSFPSLFQDQYQLKGFYRLINNKKIEHSTFISGYQAGLVAYSKAVSDDTPWFVIQDTMLTDFNTRSLDLGYTQTEQSNGFLLHHGLLLDSSFIPLGLLHQEVIFRERKDFGKSKNFRQKETSEKESNKWIEGVKTSVKFTEATGRKLIHIMDREADVSDVINLCNNTGQYFIIRARHDRSTLSHKELSSDLELEKFRLFHLMRTLPNSTIIKRNLRDEKGKIYEAECFLNYASISFRGITQNINCVLVRERASSEEAHPKEWLLLTNLTIENPEEAKMVAEYYSKRWTVEDFHKCYKTGCNIEKRQFDSRKTLTTVIGLLALTAIVLLRSRYLVKEKSNESFEKIITDKREQELARLLAKKHLKPVDYQLAKPDSVLWWLILLGRMGGHQGIKQKGLPGWQTLWKGYNYFRSLLEGYKVGITSTQDFYG